MVAVVARHAEKSEPFSAGERAHPTNERNRFGKSKPKPHWPATRLNSTSDAKIARLLAAIRSRKIRYGFLTVRFSF
jgi:hypothetical protein